MKLDTLADIPDLIYEGYMWLSDETTPRILKNAPFDASIVTESQFIIEALLWSASENISIQIKHTDKYLIHKIELNKLPENAALVERKYLAHRVEGVKKLIFKQLWQPEIDPLCESMEVLMMKAQIFVGFES